MSAVIKGLNPKEAQYMQTQLKYSYTLDDTVFPPNSDGHDRQLKYSYTLDDSLPSQQ